MLQPLAIAVIGGLLISMLLSLVVTPVVYYLLTRREANGNVGVQNNPASLLSAGGTH